jgi:hypothetical protein
MDDLWTIFGRLWDDSWTIYVYRSIFGAVFTSTASDGAVTWAKRIAKGMFRCLDGFWSFWTTYGRFMDDVWTILGRFMDDLCLQVDCWSFLHQYWSDGAVTWAKRIAKGMFRCSDGFLNFWTIYGRFMDDLWTTFGRLLSTGRFLELSSPVLVRWGCNVGKKGSRKECLGV